jgi:hypothetical protein
MMTDICAHLVDIVSNSVAAGAKNIRIAIAESKRTDLLTMEVTDDGRGMDRETTGRVLDPFFSTKTGHKVGLGVPLLKGTAETCGGTFALSSEVGKGTSIVATFRLTHPDLPPLGNLRDTFLALTVSYPDVDFVFEYNTDTTTFFLDTKDIRSELGGIPINHPEVITFLGKYLDERL